MAPIRARAAGSWRSADAGEQPEVRAAAAAAVGFRTKASGRRVVRRFPRGRVAPASGCVRELSAAVACAVMRRQARGALGAPLKKTVEKVLTAEGP